jgi:hypothetical protein
MLRKYLLAILIVCLMVTAAAQAAADEVLPAGTLLQCTLDEPNFSSRTGQIGDPVLCHLGAMAVFWAFVVSPGAPPGRSFPGLSRPWTLLWQRVDRAGV